MTKTKRKAATPAKAAKAAKAAKNTGRQEPAVERRMPGDPTPEWAALLVAHGIDPYDPEASRKMWDVHRKPLEAWRREYLAQDARDRAVRAAADFQAPVTGSAYTSPVTPRDNHRRHTKTTNWDALITAHPVAKVRATSL